MEWRGGERGEPPGHSEHLEIVLPELWEVIWGLEAGSEGAESCQVFADVISGMLQQAHEVGTLSPGAGQKTEAQSQRRRAHSPWEGCQHQAWRERQNPEGSL